MNAWGSGTGPGSADDTIPFVAVCYYQATNNGYDDKSSPVTIAVGGYGNPAAPSLSATGVDSSGNTTISWDPGDPNLPVTILQSTDGGNTYTQWAGSTGAISKGDNVSEGNTTYYEAYSSAADLAARWVRETYTPEQEGRDITAAWGQILQT